jgi:hypothetical protein
MIRRVDAPIMAAVLAPVVFVNDHVRAVVEGSMVLHMALQFPLLLLAGACAAVLLARRRPPLAAAWTRFDRDGLLATVGLSGVAALWMVPVALDAALLDPAMAAWKYMSWGFAGWCMTLAWPGMATAMRLFLLGNLAWMTCSVGLLYAETEQRLCVSYRFDEQAWAGGALCVVAVLLLGCVVGVAVRAPAGPGRPNDSLPSWDARMRSTAPRSPLLQAQRHEPRDD